MRAWSFLPNKTIGLPLMPRPSICSTLRPLSLVLAAGIGVPVAGERPVFEDVSAAAGVDFVHFNGMTGALHLVEIVGQGGALVDYDNDGDLDLYLVQGASLDQTREAEKPIFPPREVPPMDRLLRNDLETRPDGSRRLRFTDVTEAAGIRLTGNGMGVAAGDIDNDGWVDLYVTHFGPNRLLKNNGDGTFSDITVTSGTGDEGWGTSAAFLDYDRDGWLDLYVTNYVVYPTDDPVRCFAGSSRRDYCGPSAFAPQHDRLYRNRGDGTFEEVSDRVLSGYRPGPGLGVVAGDFNRDRWMDIYVANDGAVNQLWINQGGSRFVDDALFAGAAVNRAGKAEASMGVDAGDFDNDGDDDLFLTHLMGETNTLYVNDGTGIFEDQTTEHGLGARSFPFTGFGTGWLDYDNDGWLDLLVLNGAVHQIEALLAQGDPYPLGEPNQLFHNMKGKRFEEVVEPAGSPLALAEVSRGAAFGDVDNDGDTDVVVFNNSGPARLLINRVGQQSAWVGLRLLDASGRVDRLGAIVEIALGDGTILRRRSRTDGSYCSANDPRVLFGLGTATKGPVSARILWPDGTTQTVDGLVAGRYHTIRQSVPTP